ncbi:hypothetical protein NliqN6_1500 [Naganishia liquefaciens]|uniref:Glutamine amidotransferase domain-containing protein n=1 Tax=Naganishia liquefaciens TaxID=104408 RepID=A0A8H3TQM0_9TREE|nr:hypothetical protein NliqN6_1500 [Naganishia liquefaciens]
MTQTTEKRTIRVALLVNDTPVPAVVAQHGDYHQIYTAHLRDSLASYPDEALRNSVGELVVDGFDVVRGEYPRERTLTGEEGWAYDAVMMTGSASSAHEPLPWILRLIDFIRDLVTDDCKSRIKVIGICFGMQILALALGSQVKPNPAGWELGVYDVQLTDCGRDLLERITKDETRKAGLVVEGEKVADVDAKELVKGEEVLSIQQVHRDHVTSLPRDTLLIGSTPKCPIQGFIRYRSPSSKDIHILALQGHPEFVPDIVEKIIDVRAEKGVLDEPTTVEARRRARGEMRGRAGLEGRGIVGWAVMQVLLK